MASNLRSRARAKALVDSPLKLGSGPSDRSPPPYRSNSAEDKARCAICLGEVVDRSYSNSCCHNFCFGCLVEWSKVKPECPLCKTTFTAIYHNIRSIDDYDEYHVPPAEPVPQYPSISEIYQRIHQIHDDLVTVGVRRSHRIQPYGQSTFSQSSLYQPFRRAHVRIVEYVPLHHRRTETNPFREALAESYRGDDNHATVQQGAGAGIRNYQSRRRIYDRDQWVQPINTRGSSRREMSSVSYVQTHVGSISRIRAFLYRELTVLLGLLHSMFELSTVYESIMSVLEVYDMRSRELHDLIGAYIAERTRHFQHELLYFTISGLSLDEYDARAIYSVNGRPLPNGEARITPLVVDLDDSDNDQPVGFENDCVVVQNETPSSSRATWIPSSSVSYDGPWDLTTGGDLSSNEYSNANIAASAYQTSEFIERRATPSTPVIRPNDYSRWEERRNRDRFHALFQDNFSRVNISTQSSNFTFDVEHDYSSSNVPGRCYPSQHTSRSCVPASTTTSTMTEASDCYSSEIPGPSHRVTATNSNEDDDCVLVGEQPVVKKPPLAIITLSDTDDETESTPQTITSSMINTLYKNEVPDVIEDIGFEVDEFLESAFSPRVAESPSRSRRSTVEIETVELETIPLITCTRTWTTMNIPSTISQDPVPSPSSSVRRIENYEPRRHSSSTRVRRSHKKSKRKRQYSSSDDDCHRLR